ncbi:serine hydrolase [Patescibacteria group bacterium]|jgi:D-alanyl-D-alanine endopeptidase (penicillin-binding protein 7)|nr:serine hydrolase [Patescibacteria group bacterium]
MTADALLVVLSAFTLRTMQQPATLSAAWNKLPMARPAISTAPVKRKEGSLGIDIAATSAIVMDADSGAVLFEKNADAVVPIASLSKLLTAMTFLDQKPDFSKAVEIQPSDDPVLGRTILPTKERFTTQEVFDAMLIGSVNESANSLARITLGTEDFMKKMNEKAQALGLKRMHFADPSGEDSRNVGTAREVALALKYASAYPEATQAMKRASVTLHGVKKPYQINTTNLLLASDLNKGSFKVLAAKTGTLPEAGYCYALMTQGKDGQKVIVVLLGGETHFGRFQDVKALTYWAFDTFEWPGRAQVSITPNAARN